MHMFIGGIVRGLSALVGRSAVSTAIRRHTQTTYVHKSVYHFRLWAMDKLSTDTDDSL